MSKVAEGTGNLLLELNSFVGRRHDVADVKRLLGRYRLVTLTGVGGVGKTRLALRAASAARCAYPDGVWVVELGEYQASEQLVTLMAKVLNLPILSSQRSLSNISEFIGAQQMLIVLDNCEHVVECVSFIAEYLLRRCANLRILATSREILNVGGEAEFPVKPLACPAPDLPHSVDGLHSYEAVALFTERAVAVLADFELSESNKTAVAEICQRLDGLPLPIELAVLRLRTLSAQQILHQLDDVPDLLALGARGSVPRQKSLRACIDWSYNLCTVGERNLWARLSVFEGSFELDAAEAICGTDLEGSELLTVVTGLVQKSVLQPVQSDGTVRYQLPETLRNYGRQRLDAMGAYRAMRRLHCNWYVELAFKAGSDWLSSRQVMWIDRLEREHRNLCAAMSQCLDGSNDTRVGLQLAIALRPYWMASGRLREYRDWLDQAVCSDSNGTSVELVDALCTQGVLAAFQGEFSHARERIRTARLASERAADRTKCDLVIFAEGQLALAVGDSAHAADCLEKALCAAETSTETPNRLDSLLGLARAHSLRGNLANALLCNETALATAESYGESVYRARALAALASSIAREDSARAMGLLERGLRLARRVKSPLTTADCLEPSAYIAEGAGRAEEAAVLMSAATSLRKSAGILEIFPHSVEVYRSEWWCGLRRKLGDRVLDKCVIRGRDMVLSDAIDFALGEKSSRIVRRASDRYRVLTNREAEVSELVAQGLTNKAIAERLVISQRTAQGHVEHVLTKLGFTSRVQIASWVVEQSRPPV